MMRLTVPVLLAAIAVSAIAVPAIGYVPWPSTEAPAAAPAQIQSLTRVDTSTPGAAAWADLRAQTQRSLDRLTERDATEARALIEQVGMGWQAEKREWQTRFPEHWALVEQALTRATQRLASPKTELWLSKAAVLDVLSAMDAATAGPRSSTLAATGRFGFDTQADAAAAKDGKAGTATRE